MSKTKEIKNQATNGNGKKMSHADASASKNDKESKAYKSAMKAFEMTHKRLHPELYKEKAKRG